MASQSLGPRSAPQSSSWYTSSATCNRSYMMAAMRASDSSARFRSVMSWTGTGRAARGRRTAAADRTGAGCAGSGGRTAAAHWFAGASLI